MSRDFDLRNIDQNGLEAWIIATLSTEDRYLTIERIFREAPDSLVATIEDELHCERFLYYLHCKDLIFPRGDVWGITNNGILHFRNIIRPISQALQDKKRYESIIDSGDASDKVKKELKKFLGTLKDKVSDKIIDEIIRYMTIRGQEELWELIRIIIEFRDYTGQ